MTEQISNAIDAIKLAYLSHTPVVWLVTGDKEVASKIVEEFIVEHYGSYMNSGQQYLQAFSGKAADFAKEPTIFYDWYVEESNNQKDLMGRVETFITHYEYMIVNGEKIRATDEAHLKAIRQSLVIIASPSLPPKSWLTKYIDVIHVRALTDHEIRDAITLTLSSKGVDIKDNDRLDQLMVNLRGFSTHKISQTLLRCIVSGYFDYNNIDWRGILHEIRVIKRQMLDGFVGLKWIDVSHDTKPQQSKNTPKSLSIISNWLDKRRDIFKDTEKAQKAGFDIPKGVLITGIPGTGKSMMAKETAKNLDLPLISLDMGDLQEGLVGASEKHMLEALRMVEAMAPCVLWIDEIEKAFSGSNSGTSDGGVMRRMFGKFLTWMQEKTAPCFVFATSNDISKLPPELFRSERFDDKFFSFMPMVDECAAIFSTLIKEENRKYRENNIDNEFANLFSNELTRPEVWKEFLNNYSRERGQVQMDGNKWQNGVIPKCKLFTGADISMIIKLAKFDLINGCTPCGQFSKIAVHNAVRKVLDNFMPYGQTNLKDIVRCFLRLSINRFRCASESVIVNFEEFDSEKAEMSYDDNRYSDDYDKTLYTVVVGAINFYAKEIIKDENIK